MELDLAKLKRNAPTLQPIRQLVRQVTEGNGRGLDQPLPFMSAIGIRASAQQQANTTNNYVRSDSL